MSEENNQFGNEQTNSDADIDYGYGPIIEDVPDTRRKEFAPWHHPAKHLVRRNQWAVQIERLIGDGHVASGIVRYFTLPAADMMDVRYLGTRLRSRADGPWAMEVVGFDRAASLPNHSGAEPEALSILRQDGLITMASRMVPGSLEQIASSRSVAAEYLNGCAPFDVVNLDPCGHLCLPSSGAEKGLFDAFERLLQHQLRRSQPWLLFVTTRAQPANFSGAPAESLRRAVSENVAKGGPVFNDALNDAIGAGAPGHNDLGSAWEIEGERFLKVFTIGLGKHMLHWFNAQLGRQARVELASAYFYKVHGQHSDMLALAFRIRPLAEVVMPPMNGGIIQIPQTEPEMGARIAGKAARMMNVDEKLEGDLELKTVVVREKAELLRAANYPIDGWLRWLQNHEVRPMDCSKIIPS